MRAIGLPLSAVALIVVLAADLSASPESDRLVERGVAALEAQDASAALEHFDKAVAADARDPQAHLFRGAALNRLQRFDEALASLDQARRLRSANPQIDFEAGWALMALDRYDEAIAHLQRYNERNPGHGQAHEFLGRCHFAKGDLDAAERELNKAIELDPELRPTVELSLAAIDERRGEGAAADRRLRNLVTDMPAAAPSRVLRNRLGAAAPRRPVGFQPPGAKRWHLTLTSGFGYTDNVIAASDNVPLPADVSGTDSAFGRFGAILSYDLVQEADYNIVVGYAFGADEYEGQFDTSDYKSHAWWADYTRRLNDRATLTFRLADEYLNIGGSSFRNAISVRPGLIYRVTDDLSIELAYTFNTAEYYTAPTAVTDRDGESHTGSVTTYWRLPRTDFTGRAGVYFTRTDADGSDYDADFVAGFISLAHPLVWDVRGEVTFSHIDADYDNPNTFTGFAFARNDEINIVSVELTKPIDMPGLDEQSARVYLRYDFTENDSDVPAFNYDQYVISGGVVVEF